MDRRQRKLQEKRKKRELAKKKARAAATRRPDHGQLIIAAAARGPFGPCAISLGWDREDNLAGLVSVVVTRRLPDGDLVPGMALVDRTCLGIKNGFAGQKIADDELDDLLDDIGAPFGGMQRCEPLVAQSVVFHAIDYARRLGFAPDRDFPEALFGPRPAELLTTPWHAAERPHFISGPHDDVGSILSRLAVAVGPDGFDFTAGSGSLDADDDDEEDWDDDDAAQLDSAEDNDHAQESHSGQLVVTKP